MSLSLNVLTQLGIMILAGMFMGRMMKHIKLPNVTGYLLAGLLLGPYFLPSLGCPFSILSESFISGIGIISEVALGFIAFSIGNEFRISYFRKVGAAPLIIASLESLFAVVVVVAVLIVTGHDVAFSLVLGSIAAATAPAATIMVINQYKAKGPVTSTLLSVVAIDDATALILFSVSSALAAGMSGRGGNPVLSVLVPVGQILAALAVGALLGVLLLIPMRFFHKKSNRLALVCGFLFVGLGVADLMNLSSLMLCMALGAAVANLSSEAAQIISLAESVTSPICPEGGGRERRDLYRRTQYRQALWRMAGSQNRKDRFCRRQISRSLPSSSGGRRDWPDAARRPDRSGACAYDPGGRARGDAGL